FFHLSRVARVVETRLQETRIAMSEGACCKILHRAIRCRDEGSVAQVAALALAGWDACEAKRWRALARSSGLERWGVWSVSSSTTPANTFSAIIRRCSGRGMARSRR